MIDHRTHQDMLTCRAHVLAALIKEAKKRNQCDGMEWVDNERLAVAVAANQWAGAHGYRTVTIHDVERVEGQAVGHCDYASKLALYVAELVCVGRTAP
jgi:hypothetical protein